MLLTVAEAADRLRLSISKVYELVGKRKLAHFRDGGPIRIHAGHVEEHLMAARHGRGVTWPTDGFNPHEWVRLR